MLRKSSAAGMVALVTVLVSSGCGAGAVSHNGSPSASTPGVDKATKTITVGASTAVTGPESFYDSINQGSAAYFKMVDANGGVDGWKIDYKVLDDAYQPSRNLFNVEQLVQQDHVFAIVANQGTSTNAAAAHFLANTSTPVVAPAEGYPPLAHYPNYFVLMPQYGWEAALAVKYAANELKDRKVGVLYENDDLGLPARTGADAELKALGLTPVAEVPFNVTDTNLTPDVSRLQHAGADAVIMWGANSNAAAALKASAAASFKPHWFFPFWIADPSTVQLAGPALTDGIYCVSWFAPYSTPAASSFRNAMKAYEPGVAPGALSENGWSGAALFVAGLRDVLTKHESVTQKHLMSALDAMKGVAVGPVSAVTFTQGNHGVGVREEKLVRGQNGKFITATPLMQFPHAALAAHYG